MNDFDGFWKAYPRKEAKAPCKKKWQEKRLDAKAKAIIAHVEVRCVQDKKWKDGYIPMPLTFLNQERWDDEYERMPQYIPHEDKASLTVREPPPVSDRWISWINLMLLSETCAIRGGVRTEDFVNHVLPVRDSIIKYLWEHFKTDDIDAAQRDELRVMVPKIKARLAGVLNDWRSDNPKSAYAGLGLDQDAPVMTAKAASDAL